MSDTDIASRTWRKSLPDRHAITATARLYSIGSQSPHFSLTGELLNLRRRGDNQIEAGGQITAEILEHFPHLAPLAAIHLSDAHGVPMHAVDNGAYWLGFTKPCADNAPDFAAFARLWRCSDHDARRVHAYARDDNHPREAVRFCAHDFEVQWQAEADRAIALIRNGE